MIEKEFTIFFSVFHYEVTVVVTEDVVDSRNRRTVEIGHPFEGKTFALHSYKDDSSDAFLFLPFDCPEGTIAHECFHAIHRMFEYVGVEFEEETYAYHLGYLVDQIHKNLKTQ